MLSNETKFSNRDWNERVFVDIIQIGTNVQFYNLTNAYLVGSEMAIILLRVQKRLGINGYHQCHITTSKKLFTYIVHKRFLFLERLNDIIQQLKSSGLYDLWEQKEYAKREKKIAKHNLKRLKISRAVTSSERSDFPMFIVYGWFAGVVVFILEIVWKKCVVNRKSI